MPLCKLCNKFFPTKLEIDGKTRNFQNRKYCLECSPFGSGNTKKLEKEWKSTSKEEKKHRNNAKYKKWQQKARKERKEKLVELAGGKCNICGYKRCMRALEFHHKDLTSKEEKGFGISTRGMLGRWEKLLEEIKKCILVCSNCHREIHSGILVV